MRLKNNRYWLLLPVVVVLALLGWRYAAPLWEILSDPVLVEKTVAQMGWYGPAVLVLLNTLQIVFAPIPGYVVQVAAGYLYGPIWGGLYGSIGMLLGATIAFWLARIFGRPLVERLVGRSRLEKWEIGTHTTSIFIWFLLLLGPTGDVPYFLAGLSSVGFVKILIATALMRIPAVFLAAAAGAMAIPWWQLVIIYSVIAGIAAIFLVNQKRLQQWMARNSNASAAVNPVTADVGQDQS